jgi:hypothetical protein
MSVIRITVTLEMRTSFEGVSHSSTFSYEPQQGDELAAMASAKNDEILNARLLASAGGKPEQVPVDA